MGAERVRCRYPQDPDLFQRFGDSEYPGSRLFDQEVAFLGNLELHLHRPGRGIGRVVSGEKVAMHQIHLGLQVKGLAAGQDGLVIG